MENDVLNDIIDYAVKALKNSYGYCAVAKNPEMALINSDDKKGQDFEIHIKIKKNSE